MHSVTDVIKKEVIASRNPDEMETMSLYHYTNHEGCQGIYQEKAIYGEKTLKIKFPNRRRRRSSGDKCEERVFLTDKCPIQSTKRQIVGKIYCSKNEADFKPMLTNGRANYVYAIEIRKSQVLEVDPEHAIWKYPKDTLDLKDKSLVQSWGVYEVKEEYVSEFKRGVKDVKKKVGEVPRLLQNEDSGTESKPRVKRSSTENEETSPKKRKKKKKKKKKSETVGDPASGKKS